MSRKVRRVPVHLDAGDIRDLPSDEIVTILRGADDLIMRGGRSLLAKLLKGSRDNQILERGLENSPAHGSLRSLSREEILARIDWLILNEYLAIEYDYRLPLLVYAPRGWEIERETFAVEIHGRVDNLIAAGETAPDLAWLNDLNRQVVLRLLERIEASGDARYLPALEAWAENTFNKIRKRIHHVVENLKNRQ